MQVNNPTSGQFIREADFPMGSDPLPRDVAYSIVSKSLIRSDNFQRFWATRLKLGKDCFGALVGDIFTEKEKEWYAKQDKMLLSIPELVPKINALEGMQIGGRRDGVIVPVDGVDAPDTEVIGTLVKSHQTKNHLDLEETAMFTDGLVTGYPSAMWFEKPDPLDLKNKKLEIFHEIWDSILYDPKFSRIDLTNCEEVIRRRALSRQQVLSTYPTQRAAIEEHILENGTFDTGNNNTSSAYTSAERDNIFNQMMNSRDLYSRTGLVMVVERNFFILKTVPLYVSPYGDVQILPSDWTPQEVTRWTEFHPDYKKMQKEVRLLWVTTCTSSGLLLENRAHWFQEGEFPCEVFIPRVWNNKFYGVVEFLQGSLKGRNVTKIEHLHSLRMANDGLMVAKEGSIVNPADAAREKGRTGGIIVRSRFSSPDDIEFPANEREQMGWKDMSDTFLQDIDRLSVDANFEGGVQSSQESGTVVDRRVLQTQMKYSPYMSTYNLTHLRIVRKILLMLPYVHTEQEILRWIDPKTADPKEVTLNEQTDLSWVSEAVGRVKNNLVGAKYDYVEAEGDNSVTAKEHEMIVFNGIMEQLAKIQQVTLWPFLLTSVPNRMAQEFGQKLQEFFDAQAQAKQMPEKPKVSLAFVGADLIHNPMAIQILTNEGIIPPQQQSNAPAGQPPQGGQPMAAPQAAQPQSPQMANVGR